MSSYGVTPDGFVIKPLEQIKADVEARLRGTIDAGLNLTPSSPDGQHFHIMCELLHQMWELAQATGSTWDPDSAVGVWLENIAATTGTVKEDAFASEVSVNVTTDQAVNVAAGAFVLSVVGNPAARFQNVNPIVTAGAQTVAASFVAQETGPVIANAGTLTVIETPTTGITGVTNPLDAELGADIERDEALRARREEELDAAGAGTLDSIEAILEKVEGVEAVRVFENKTDVTDVNGRPPHSIHAIVLGGAGADIWQAIWDSVGGGINMLGAQVGTAVDRAGGTQTTKFDRASELEVYLVIDIDYIVKDYPVDGDTQIKSAVVAKGNTLKLGNKVVAERLSAEAFKISGVYDVTGFRLGFVPSPLGSANLPVDFDEIARFDTSRVLINKNAVPPP